MLSAGQFQDWFCSLIAPAEPRDLWSPPHSSRCVRDADSEVLEQQGLAFKSEFMDPVRFQVLIRRRQIALGRIPISQPMVT